MTRVFLGACFFLFAAALIMFSTANRYQFFSVTGPSWNGNPGTETDMRRIDRWTATPQVWVCQDVDTSQAANVPPPPAQPADFGNAPADSDSMLRNGTYLIALKAWRARHPNVNPETLRLTIRRCAWEVAR